MVHCDPLQCTLGCPSPSLFLFVRFKKFNGKLLCCPFCHCFAVYFPGQWICCALISQSFYGESVLLFPLFFSVVLYYYSLPQPFPPNRFCGVAFLFPYYLIILFPCAGINICYIFTQIYASYNITIIDFFLKIKSSPVLVLNLVTCGPFTSFSLPFWGYHLVFMLVVIVGFAFLVSIHQRLLH